MKNRACLTLLLCACNTTGAPSLQTSGGAETSAFAAQKLKASTGTLATTFRTVTFRQGNLTGATMHLSIGYGSAAFHSPFEPANEVWTAGDRGPNFGCKDDDSAGQPYTGLSAFCDDAGVVFPVVGYVPSLYHLRLATSGGRLTATVLETVALHDAGGQPISGISNAFAEPPFSSIGSALPADDSGLDSEGLVRLYDGSFWVSEEYAPSLVHVAADGTVLERVVPKGRAVQLGQAAYPVSDGLPGILTQRAPNRGIESLGISPDQTTLYFAMQSPLANPDDDAYKHSRNVRLFTVSLGSEGSFTSVTHEYVYELDMPEQFPDAGATKQHNVSLSEMTVLTDGRLLLDEHAGSTTTLVRIDLTRATDILGTQWDSRRDSNTSNKTLETADLSTIAAQDKAGVVTVTKTRVFDSHTDAPRLGSKIEGVALLDATNLFLVSDNDFGIDGAPTTLTILPLVPQLTR